MKKLLLFSLLLFITMASAQQFTYSVQLNSTDSIDTQKWLVDNPFSNKEKEIAQKYANLISPTLRQYVSTQNCQKKIYRTLYNAIFKINTKMFI